MYTISPNALLKVLLSKLIRNPSKYAQILNEKSNTNYCEEPSKNLMVGNAGLVSGLEYEQVVKLFSEYSVEKIVMSPDKAYSFVVFSTVSDAEKAYTALSGQVKLVKMDKPLYLLYHDSVPTQYDVPLFNPLPEGLTLLNDFVSMEEEVQLLNCINWDVDNEDTAKTLKHRRVKHYGYEFRYDTNNVDKDLPLSDSIPAECNFIESRLQNLGHSLPWTPDQLTVNQHQKGQGIPSRIETHSAFESPLLSLSLGSDVVMEFRQGASQLPVLLPRRSLLIMDGEARYAWTHGITPRKVDVVSVAGGLSVRERGCRTSLTLRKVRQGPCQCDYAAYCDSQQQNSHAIIPEDMASRLEEFFVHQVYENIASHFNETRPRIWPNVKEFLQSFSAGSIIIDAGCGNGKYFGVNPNIFQVGFDHSYGLAEITQGHGHEVFVSDSLTLPVQDELVDGIISIAVLHHVSTSDRRLQALREISRVLVPGGRALIVVQAIDNIKGRKGFYLMRGQKNRRDDNQNELHEPRVPMSDNVLGVDEDRMTENQDTPIKSGDEKSVGSIPFKLKTRERYNEDSVASDFQLPVQTARRDFQHQEMFLQSKVKSKDANSSEENVILTYYHVFVENELFQLCSKLRDINILETYYTKGNCCIIFEKVKSLA